MLSRFSATSFLTSSYRIATSTSRGDYGLIRQEEHPHGGFYYRSLWILNRDAVIAYKSVPWEGNAEVEEYQRLFKLIGSEPGEWRPTCGLAAAEKSHAS